MSEQDIHAAAERVRRVRDGGSWSSVYASVSTETKAEMQLDYDLYVIADAYLALLDDTPITEEWLDQIPQVTYSKKSAFGFWVELDLVEGHVQTIGQLRALLLAMGVKHD